MKRAAIWLLGLSLALAAAPAAACPRIVSQAPYLTLSLKWLGLDQCIVGASRYDRLPGVTDTGGVMDPDADVIELLQPDLVLLSDWVKRPPTLPAARVLVLHGFGSMAEVEENLRRIGEAAGLKEAAQRARHFADQWRRRARSIQGDGRRVLLLSTCSNAPYSLGRHTWLHELFVEAGFRPLDDHEGTHFVGPGRDFADLGALIDHLRPELLFLFQPKTSSQCAAVPRREGIRVIALHSDHFLHPAPVLLDGLDELKQALAKD